MFNCEDLFLDRARIVMKFMGVWLPPLKESAISKSYRIFMVFLQYLFLIFQLIYIAQVWGDLEAIAQACYLLFTQACLCFKVTVFVVNDDLLRSLLEQMNSNIFQPQSKEDERILKQQASRIKRFLLSFMISSQTTCGLWALKPLFDDAGSRNFPFNMWMPVTPETSPQYEFGYAFQLVTICISAYMYFGVDSVAMSSVIFGCAQIQIVQDKIMSVSSVNYKTKSEDRAEILSRNHKILVECVNQYQAIFTISKEISYLFMVLVAFSLHAFHFMERKCILCFCFFELVSAMGTPSYYSMGRISIQAKWPDSLPDDASRAIIFFNYCFTQMVEDAYHTYLLFQLTGSVGIFCMSALRILVISWQSMQFFSIISYLFVMSSQLFVVCWCGNELTSTSEELHTVMYKCMWYEQDVRFKKDLCFAMMRMSRPMVLRAGHYVTLSWQTYIAVLRMSYSYFAVLNQAHK